MKAEYAANDEPVLQMPLKGMSAASLHAKLAEKVGLSGVHAHRPAQEASASRASDCLSVSRAVKFTGCCPAPDFFHEWQPVAECTPVMRSRQADKDVQIAEGSNKVSGSR